MKSIKTDLLRLAVGSYAFIDNTWYCHPVQNALGNLSNHTIVEHEDGTITVSPSILINYCDNLGFEHEWHGYLEKGIFRQI